MSSLSVEDAAMPKTRKRRGRPSAIARFSIADIRGEIDGRHEDLQARREFSWYAIPHYCYQQGTAK